MSIVFGTPTTGNVVLLVEPGGDAERVLAADGDERVQPLLRAKFSSTRSTPPSTLYGFVRVVPRIVPPRGQDPRDRAVVERLELALDEAAPALPHADDLVAAVERAAGDRADDRVQPRAVASSGEECNALRSLT